MFPDTIYETPDNWGEILYLNESDMDECIDQLIDAGGEDWEDISISDCRKHTLIQELTDGKAAYEGVWITDGYNRNGRREIAVFTRNTDGSFDKVDSLDPQKHADEIDELGITV